MAHPLKFAKRKANQSKKSSAAAKALALAVEAALEVARQKATKRRRRAAKLAVSKKAAAQEASKPAPRNKLKIGAEVVARSRKSKPTVKSFIPASHPPGVQPAQGMAQDEALSPALSWAAQSVYAGAFQEGLTFLGYPYLAELSQRPEYRRIVEVIATEMTRKWIKVQSTSDDDDDKADKITAVEAALEKYNVRGLFCKMAELDGYFGRGHLYFDFGDSDDRDEILTPIANSMGNVLKDKIKQGSLVRIKAIEPVWCYPSNYNSSNPLHADWYNPSRWIVQGTEMHRSRLLSFVGRELPDLLKPAYSFGGLALTQMAKPYVDNWLRTRQSVSDLISNFSVAILKTDLQTLLAPGENEATLFERAELFNNLRDNRGLMMLNKDSEDFANITTPLSSLDLLQAQSQEHMASVSGIPLVKLLGIQPAGLNASSEGEIRTFYDWIEAYQQKLFAEKLGYVMDVIQLSEFGEIDPDITFKFETLWSLDDKELAEVRKIEAETDDILINGCGALAPEESRQRIAGDPNTPYEALDVEDLPEPPDQTEGAEAGGSLNMRGTAPLEEKPDGDPEAATDSAKEWNESKHPRVSGGPNAGQFGTGVCASKAQTQTAPKKSAQSYTPSVKASGLRNAEKKKKEWRREAPATVDAIYATAQKNQDQLAAASESAAKRFGAEFKNPGIKSKKRLMEKISRGKKPSAINDAIRGGFNVKTPQDGDRVIKALAEKFEVADEGFQKTDSGYFDRKVMVRFEDGSVGEVQQWPPGMLEVKEFGGQTLKDYVEGNLSDPKKTAAIEGLLVGNYGNKDNLKVGIADFLTSVYGSVEAAAGQVSGHKLYEEWQKLPRKSPEAEALNAKMVELYSKVEAVLPPQWSALFKKPEEG